MGATLRAVPLSRYLHLFLFDSPLTLSGRVPGRLAIREPGNLATWAARFPISAPMFPWPSLAAYIGFQLHLCDRVTNLAMRRMRHVKGP